MGMFDTITCQHALPDACPQREFQTKSLDCVLCTYSLTAAGRLLDAQGRDTGLHGVLRMSTRDAAGQWWEYEAKFTEGQLVHLLPVAQARYDESGIEHDVKPPTLDAT